MRRTLHRLPGLAVDTIVVPDDLHVVAALAAREEALGRGADDDEVLVAMRGAVESLTWGRADAGDADVLVDDLVARAPDRELQNSQYEPRPPVARTESSAASDAEHDKSSPEVAGLPSSAAARQAMRPDGICSKNVQRDPGAERGFDDEPQALPLKSPVTSSDEDPMLTKSEVAKLLRVHVNTIDNYRKQRGFPREHKFGPNTLRWKRGEILQWRDQRQRK